MPDYEVDLDDPETGKTVTITLSASGPPSHEAVVAAYKAHKASRPAAAAAPPKARTMIGGGSAMRGVVHGDDEGWRGFSDSVAATLPLPRRGDEEEGYWNDSMKQLLLRGNPVTGVPMLIGDQLDQVKQAYQAAQPNIDELKQAIRLAGQGEFKKAAGSVVRAGYPNPEASGHALAAALPLIGPMVANTAGRVGEQLGAGKYAGAAGTALGTGAQVIGPEAALEGVRGVRGAVRGAVDAPRPYTGLVRRGMAERQPAGSIRRGVATTLGDIAEAVPGGEGVMEKFAEGQRADLERGAKGVSSLVRDGQPILDDAYAGEQLRQAGQRAESDVMTPAKQRLNRVEGAVASKPIDISAIQATLKSIWEGVTQNRLLLPEAQQALLKPIAKLMQWDPANPGTITDPVTGSTTRRGPLTFDEVRAAHRAMEQLARSQEVQAVNPELARVMNRLAKNEVKQGIANELGLNDGQEWLDALEQYGQGYGDFNRTVMEDVNNAKTTSKGQQPLAPEEVTQRVQRGTTTDIADLKHALSQMDDPDIGKAALAAQKGRLVEGVLKDTGTPQAPNPTRPNEVVRDYRGRKMREVIDDLKQRGAWDLLEPGERAAFEGLANEALATHTAAADTSMAQAMRTIRHGLGKGAALLTGGGASGAAYALAKLLTDPVGPVARGKGALRGAARPGLAGVAPIDPGLLAALRLAGVTSAVGAADEDDLRFLRR